MTRETAERLYQRAVDIREGNANGHWVPIMWHLALRRHPDAMIDLAHWFSEGNRLADLGAAKDSFSAAGLYRRAWRHGHARAAQHLAMGCFNRRDLNGYRLWLRRAATAGDPDCRRELRSFETRLPHDAARDIGRQRPVQRRDGYARRSVPLPIPPRF
jgi:TPR repeat protein